MKERRMSKFLLKLSKLTKLLKVIEVVKVFTSLLEVRLSDVVVSVQINNGIIREALLNLSRDMTTRVNRGIDPRSNVVESTMTYRLRDLVRMNPHIFLDFRVGEDPQEFLDGVNKVLRSMRVTSREKAEL